MSHAAVPEFLFIHGDQLDWSLLKKLVAARQIALVEIYESEDGSTWDVTIDVSKPGYGEASYFNLPILLTRNSNEPRTWTSLNAARTSLRKVGHAGGVTVHFWAC